MRSAIRQPYGCREVLCLMHDTPRFQGDFTLRDMCDWDHIAQCETTLIVTTADACHMTYDDNKKTGNLNSGLPVDIWRSKSKCDSRTRGRLCPELWGTASSLGGIWYTYPAAGDRCTTDTWRTSEVVSDFCTWRTQKLSNISTKCYSILD